MIPRLSTLQRAFEMAQSGQFKSLNEIRAGLKREGYRDGEAQTSGRYIQSQLERAWAKGV